MEIMSIYSKRGWKLPGELTITLPDNSKLKYENIKERVVPIINEYLRQGYRASEDEITKFVDFNLHQVVVKDDVLDRTLVLFKN